MSMKENSTYGGIKALWIDADKAGMKTEDDLWVKQLIVLRANGIYFKDNNQQKEEVLNG